MGINMNGAAKSARRLARYLLLFEIFINAVQFGLIFVAIGHDANSATECNTGNSLCNNVVLGKWYNFPYAGNNNIVAQASQCDEIAYSDPGCQSCAFSGGVFQACGCSVPTLSNKTLGSSNGDACELFSQHIYRKVYPTDGSSHSVTGSVQCVSPAEHTAGGTVLYLQYANYSYLDWDNTSNWIIPASPASVYIDNTVWPCPGTDAGQVDGGAGKGLSGTLPAEAAGTGYEFRIVLVCACNATVPVKLPIISGVDLWVQQASSFITYGASLLATPGTASFRYEGWSSANVITSTDIQIDWHATNLTGSVGCGPASLGFLDKCFASGQTGTGICTIPAGSNSCASSTISFPFTFTGTVTVTFALFRPVKPSVSLISYVTLTIFQVQQTNA